jgi:glycosyltransferase involved in cell wall biosynthesis
VALRLLFLTPQLPFPPHQGTAMRNYGLIAGLACRHQVHLLSFLAPGDNLDSALPLQQICETIDAVPQPVRTRRQRLWAFVTSPLPDMAHRLASPAFERSLMGLLDQYRFDVIEFEGIEMIPYLAAVLDRYSGAEDRPCLVFDDHNAEYVLQRRVFEMDVRLARRLPGALYSLVQWQRLKRYEAWACRRADVVIAVSGPDAEALRRIAPELPVTVVPNGIDVADYRAFDARQADLPSHSLVFTGKMDYRPNVDAALWFAQQVLPLVQDRVPDARFYVVGQRPHARLDVIRGRPGVVITGRVPEIKPYLAGAAVYVIPLRSGGGTRFKVLEAMSMGRPIVSTSMGCDGFPVTSGQEAVLADEPDAFADRVVELLQDPARQEALVRAASEFVMAYDWSVIVPRLEAAYATERETTRREQGTQTEDPKGLV